MAKKIEPTPTLDLEDNKEFLDKLEEPISDEEKAFMKDVFKTKI